MRFWNISISSGPPEKLVDLSLGRQTHLGLLPRPCTWPGDSEGEGSHTAHGSEPSFFNCLLTCPLGEPAWDVGKAEGE